MQKKKTQKSYPKSEARPPQRRLQVVHILSMYHRVDTVGGEDHERSPFLGTKRQRSVIVKNKNDLKRRETNMHSNTGTPLSLHNTVEDSLHLSSKKSTTKWFCKKTRKCVIKCLIWKIQSQLGAQVGDEKMPS